MEHDSTASHANNPNARLCSSYTAHSGRLCSPASPTPSCLNVSIILVLKHANRRGLPRGRGRARGGRGAQVGRVSQQARPRSRSRIEEDPDAPRGSAQALWKSRLDVRCALCMLLRGRVSEVLVETASSTRDGDSNTVADSVSVSGSVFSRECSCHGMG